MTFRKKSNIIVCFVVPILAVLFALAVFGNPTAGSVKVGVVNQDRSSIAGEMVKSLGNKYKVITLNQKDIEDQITSGRVDCVAVIPPGFSAGIYSGKFKSVEIPEFDS